MAVTIAIEGTLIWRNAEYEKPLHHKTVLVEGGVAFWDGNRWMTRMEYPWAPIEWEVEWWADLPSTPKDI